MSLRDLRKARKLTQARIAKPLGITQDSVSRLEKRSDLLISTLRKPVKAMGGDVRTVTEFPGRSPVVRSGPSEDDSPRKSSSKHACAQAQNWLLLVLSGGWALPRLPMLALGEWATTLTRGPDEALISGHLLSASVLLRLSLPAVGSEVTNVASRHHIDYILGNVRGVVPDALEVLGD
ncbi:MAG: helix-turn-helix domain-containing protein [Candidatus Acidiferrales bacterium]